MILAITTKIALALVLGYSMYIFLLQFWIYSYGIFYKSALCSNRVAHG
jgi:hypothetical protein